MHVTFCSHQILFHLNAHARFWNYYFGSTPFSSKQQMRGHPSAQLVEQAPHVQSLCPHCSGLGFELFPLICHLPVRME